MILVEVGHSHIEAIIKESELRRIRDKFESATDAIGVELYVTACAALSTIRIQRHIDNEEI